MNGYLFVLLIEFLTVCYVEAAFRYENRTLTCAVSDGIDKCFLTAPDSKLRNLELDVKCRREPTDDGKKQRLACPIRCPKEYEVHVLNKIPSSNRKCTKYYTYGKYPDDREWWVHSAEHTCCNSSLGDRRLCLVVVLCRYIWMLEPCISTISTHCRYPDDVTEFVV